MSNFIKATTAAALPQDLRVTTLAPLVAGWYRPRHALIWAEVRRLGKQIIAPSRPEPAAKPKPRRELRFTV